MPLININLLAKQQNRVSRLGQANFTAAVAAGVIIGLQLLIVVFLYSTIGIRNAEKNNALNKTAEQEGKIVELDKQTENSTYPDMTLKQQADAFQAQLDAAKVLIDNHKYFSLYLSEIAINTPSTIIYDSFNSDSPNRLTITGRATSYAEVSKLAENFKQLTFAKSTSIQDAKFQQGSYPIKFTILIDLKSAGELKKLPGPVPKPGQAAPSAKPSPRPTSSSLPSPGIGGFQ